ncbi:hypothetical protein WBJ53_13880 [Spirosoma sp. SC4-14]|uniref:hypothetical protein n=1 Tax=Spirosoma sp. SC4-14 TaxID=3128900 RepID=UPI0030D53302
MFKITLNSPKAYETIKVRLGNEDFYTDLYYYCTDNTFFEEHASMSKGLLNFVCMVENWKVSIKKLGIGSSTALPFDFSDEYVGFFIVTAKNDKEVKIQSAYTKGIHGVANSPSDFNSTNFLDEPYEVDDKSYTMPVQELLDSIEDSMTAIFSEFYKK